MRDNNKLRAYELAGELAIIIYQATRKISKKEMYGLTSQIRIAAISVPSNIVEGCNRESQREFIQNLTANSLKV